MPVPSVAGTLIVNIGDISARWTNEAFNSTPHPETCPLLFGPTPPFGDQLRRFSANSA
ncbi:MAG: hypothetical protein HQ502_02880 [Alphaproteobacteria bacterium]|nr:hypothetical protein [Alphaproteobacteria bacterium]